MNCNICHEPIEAGEDRKAGACLQCGSVPARNSLTPDDRLFLAYLAAWTVGMGRVNGFTKEDLMYDAKRLCENYKEQEK